MKQCNNNYDKALNFAYFYLKFRFRTKKEVINYLHKKSKKYHFSGEVIDQVIKTLEEQELINDKKFIEWFIEQRSKSKQKGEFVLRGELIRFGIEKNLIDEYFENNRLDEEKLADEALKSRWERFKNLDKKMRFQKAAQFLLRRGFDFDIIKKTINKLIDKNAIA